MNDIFADADKSRSLLKAFLVFRCGHKFHKKCVVSKKQMEKEEKSSHGVSMKEDKSKMISLVKSGG